MPILQYEVKPLNETTMPLAIDFGTSNTTAGIYIDKEILLRIRENINNELINETLERSDINRINELFRRFSRKFEDSSECLVIIDEVQESSEIFSMIRQFARDVKTNFIITGSYLGRASESLRSSLWAQILV